MTGRLTLCHFATTTILQKLLKKNQVLNITEIFCQCSQCFVCMLPYFGTELHTLKEVKCLFVSESYAWYTSTHLHTVKQKKKVISVSSPGLEILLKLPPNYVYQFWLCSAEFSGAQDKRAFQKLRSTCYILRSTPFQKL